MHFKAYALIFGVFAALYYFIGTFEKIKMNKLMSNIHFWLTLVCTQCLFFPFDYLGKGGVPLAY